MGRLLRFVRKEQFNFIDYVGGAITIHFLFMGNWKAALATFACEFLINVFLAMAGFKREGNQ